MAKPRKNGDKCANCGKRPRYRTTSYCRPCWNERTAKWKERVANGEEMQSRDFTGERGKCSRCGKDFALESWQHSKLHWCDDCRRLPDYKECSLRKCYISAHY